MVGLSVVLEGYKDNTGSTTYSSGSSSSQVVNKASMIIKPPSPSYCSPSPASPSGKSPFSRRSTPATGFLDCCFLCKQKLLPGKDIYMYKGDRGFCSVECRCRQIAMDEEELAMKSSSKRDHCSLAAMKPQRPAPSTPPPPPSPKARRGATGNRPNGFAY